MAQVINWQRVLDTNHVEYIERGPNVRRGNLNIRCPFCGNADPSYHMGIDLSTGYWGCWRNASHRGKSPVRLLVKLLNISFAKAMEMAGFDKDYIDPDGFTEAVAKFMNKLIVENAVTKLLTFPEDFKQINPMGRTSKFWNYLVDVRGFADSDIPSLCRDYTLLASTGGLLKDRVVMPYVMNFELVGWTGRAIAESTIRYKDIPLDEALVAPKETLYNHDCMLDKNRNLVVVEGQIDVLKMDFYGKDFGTRAVGISTNSMTDAQIYLLDEFSSNFKTVYFMLDNKTSFGIVDSMKLRQRVSQIRNAKIINVPFDAGDAGELTPHQVATFTKDL